MHAVAASFNDRLSDEVSVFLLVTSSIDLRRVACRVLIPKRLVLALPVVIDDRRGQRQDASGRTIVLLELDDPCARIVLLEIENVPDVGPAPTIHRVVNKEPAGHIVA